MSLPQLHLTLVTVIFRVEEGGLRELDFHFKKFRKTLDRHGRVAFKMVSCKNQDAFQIVLMETDFCRPIFQRLTSGPLQFGVMMRLAAIGMVAGSRITQQPDDRKVRAGWVQIKRRPIRAGQRGEIAPDITHIVLFQKMHRVRMQPAFMPEFNRPGPRSGKLTDEIAQGVFVVVGIHPGGKLNNDRADFGLQRLQPLKKIRQQLLAIPQPVVVGYFPGQLAGENKIRRRDVSPVLGHCSGRRMIKRGIHLHRLEVVRVKLKPLGRREMIGVEDAAPVVMRPCAGPKMQMTGWRRIRHSDNLGRSCADFTS